MCVCSTFFGFESWCLGLNPGEVDVFVPFIFQSMWSVRMCVCVCVCVFVRVCVTRFWGSNPGEVNFFHLILFFLLSRECNSIEGCCLCCINFYLWDFSCMAVNKYTDSCYAQSSAIITFISCY